MGPVSWREVPDGAIIAIDTVVLVYFLERHPDYYQQVRELFRRIEDGRLHAVMSSLVLTELLVPAYREGKEQSAERLAAVLQNYPNLKIVPLSCDIAVKAARLRASHGLRTPDAIHVATALQEQCSGLVTNDHGLLRMQSELAIWVGRS